MGNRDYFGITVWSQGYRASERTNIVRRARIGEGRWLWSSGWGSAVANRGNKSKKYKSFLEVQIKKKSIKSQGNSVGI